MRAEQGKPLTLRQCIEGTGSIVDGVRTILDVVIGTWSTCPCRMSRGPSGFSAGPGPGGQGAPADNDPKGMTLAAKMMEKMGWKVMPL